MDDEAERTLRLQIMTADLALKTKQAFWETPRNLVLIIGTMTASAAALSGFIGYKLGQNSPPIQIIVQPGTSVSTAAPTK